MRFDNGLGVHTVKTDLSFRMALFFLCAGNNGKYCLLMRLHLNIKTPVKKLLVRYSPPSKPLTLSSARCGERLRIVEIASSPDAQRLKELGLCETAEIQKIVDGNALVCILQGSRFAIARDLGASVLVEGGLP